MTLQPYTVDFWRARDSVRDGGSYQPHLLIDRTLYVEPHVRHSCFSSPWVHVALVVGSVVLPLVLGWLVGRFA